MMMSPGTRMGLTPPQSGDLYGPPLLRWTKADQSLNSATFVDAPDLYFEIGAGNEVWHFDGQLYVSGNANSDFRMTMVGPTGVIGRWGVLGLTSAATGTAGNLVLGSSSDYSGAGVPNTFAALGSGTGVPPVTFSGIVEAPNRNGIVKVQWACVTALGAVTLAAYSWIRAMRLN